MLVVVVVVVVGIVNELSDEVIADLQGMFDITQALRFQVVPTPDVCMLEVESCYHVFSSS